VRDECVLVRVMRSSEDFRRLVPQGTATLCRAEELVIKLKDQARLCASVPSKRRQQVTSAGIMQDMPLPLPLPLPLLFSSDSSDSSESFVL
jgi:hypothetical protein